MVGIHHAPSLLNWLLILASMLSVELAGAAVRCERNLVANVVAFDQPLMFNRLGAQNANGMMFALRRDVVDEHEQSLAYGGAAVPGKVSLRPDKRPRPLVLRVAAGDCLTINLQNLLAYQANPNKHFEEPEVEGEEGEENEGVEANMPDDFKVDEQVADRLVRPDRVTQPAPLLRVLRTPEAPRGEEERAGRVQVGHVEGEVKQAFHGEQLTTAVSLALAGLGFNGLVCSTIRSAPCPTTPVLISPNSSPGSIS